MRPPAPANRSKQQWFWPGLLLFCIACTVLGSPTGQDRVSVQQWLKSRGPVVPHDTFPNDCMTCHEGGGWHTIRADFEFDHEKETGVPLKGAHKQAECLRCHNDRGPVANFSDQGCVGCHERWHKGQLGSNCVSCHDQESWQPRQVISKHSMTRFPLVGSHAGVACWACHPGAQVGDFKRASNECVDCHRDRLAMATVPDHQGNGWTTRCQRCHSPVGWKGASFVHSLYPLTGAHKSVPCSDCHKNNVYKGTPRNCVDCHLADYNATTDPNHPNAGLPTQCETCHTTNGWSGANFKHQWPLLGAHLAVPCTSCHKNQVYKGTPKDCLSCHQSDYAGTTDPDHQKAGFSTQCETCHDANAWKGAQYNHNWPLTGAHRSTSCIKCHKNQVYKGTPTTCYACHKTDYDNTTNPNHRGQGYPTDCTSCHTTSAFKPSTFVHKFPLVKKHAVSCNICHTVPTNFQTFTCIVCHEHDKTKMDDKHKGKKGYVYSSPACYNCHPQSKGG